MSPNHISTPSQDLQQQLRETREQLLSQDLYLGSPSFREKAHVVWRDWGRGNHLVIAEDGPPTEGKLATLLAVVQITSDDFWMMPCGMWKGKTKACKSFADMKLTCTGYSSGEKIFQDDYDVILDNLRWLMEKTETPGINNKRGVLLCQGHCQKIRFRHILFEVIDNDIGNDNI